MVCKHATWAPPPCHHSTHGLVAVAAAHLPVPGKALLTTWHTGQPDGFTHMTPNWTV